MGKSREFLVEQALSSLARQIDLNDNKNISAKDLEELINKKFRQSYLQDKPECFLPLNILLKGYRPFFPICNRDGAMDPKIIKISKEIADKLVGSTEVDQDHLAKMHLKMVMLLHKLGSGNGPI